MFIQRILRLPLHSLPFSINDLFTCASLSDSLTDEEFLVITAGSKIEGGAGRVYILRVLIPVLGSV